MTIELRPAAAASVVLRSASGATVRLADGREVIDLASGGFGYTDPRVTEAVAGQLRRLPLSSRTFLSRPLAELTAALAELTPGDLQVSYLCNSSSEAVDGAIKLARGYHRHRLELVAILPGEEESSPAELIAQYPRWRSLARLPIQIRIVGSRDPAAVRRAVTKRTCAVLVEPVGTGLGIQPLPPGYLAAVRAACDRTGALLIADETVTGLGRTGAMFAVDHAGVVPDVLVVGGALGGGVLPIGGYVTSRRINTRVYGRRTPVLHGTTTGGSPAACVAALAALRVIQDERIVARARRGQAEIRAAFAGSAVTARGFALGLLASVPASAAQVLDVQRAAWDAGVLVSALATGGGQGWLRILPPLLTSTEELSTGLDAFANALDVRPLEPDPA
jgi:acetylornithine/succinyldiaminopimelate/putrescine aminotransferase